MAANSDGKAELTTIVTCEGDLTDRQFPSRLQVVVDELNGILRDVVKVRKLEPWNSVRVTLSIPREAALRLRQLANEGSQQLRALGILSVQVEGDQVISLRVASGSLNSEPQEILLRTAQDAADSSDQDVTLSNLLPTADGATIAPTAVTGGAPTANAASTQVQFKSPNVVCPADSVVPKVGGTSNNVAPNSVSGGAKPFAGPFPFTSMNQAMHSNRESPYNTLPPPYPGNKPPQQQQQPQPPVTISSPLLVNLLQNDGKEPVTAATVGSAKTTTTVRTAVRTTAQQHRNVVMTTASSTLVTTPKLSATTSQTNVLMNNVSPSALSINTSIRQNSSTILTSTTGVVNKTPPPQYHRALSASMVKQQAYHSAVNSASTTTQNPIQQNNSTMNVFNPKNPPPPLLGQTGSSLQTNKLIPKNSPLQHKTSLYTSNMTLTKNPTSQQKTVVHNNQSINSASISHVKNPSSVSLSKSGSFVKMTSGNYVTSNSPQILQQASSTPLPTAVEALNANPTSLNNVISRSLPSPPPYSVAISRPWDTLVHSNPLMDLTPSLTDLKPDDLDELLPTLERELTQSPLPDIPEDFLAVHSNIISTTEEVTPPKDNRKFLINPLTGELEPQSSEDSDTEELKDVFTGLPSPAALSDDDTCSTTRPDTTTDQSDSETTRQSDANKPPRLKNSKVRERGRDSPALKPEKIKLRLKLEKSEPINPAYKVDVSFINTQPKKASAGMMTTTPTGEELRVPPLHISLRGRNSVVIKNKNKVNPDGTIAKQKIRKNQEQIKVKKNLEVANNTEDATLNSNNALMIEDVSNIDQIKLKMGNFEQKKIKKLKAVHDHKDIIASLTQDKYIVHNHFKEKQKERRGSDSELVRNNKKYSDNNGVIIDEKKRRLSQVEADDDNDVAQPTVLGSTNIGTITSLPQKPRKDKAKVKEIFKKEVGRNKMFVKTLSEKLQSKSVVLPIANEMDMEAKFKQGLLEGSAEKGVVRPPHRTEVTINHLSTENCRIETKEKTLPTLEEKSPSETDKNESAVTVETVEKPVVTATTTGIVVGGGRATSPTGGGSNSSGQGEDSGIESMDALSEKSPNQASQSPHGADILTGGPAAKTQVPNMLDIEAQLAKMEGLNGDIVEETSTAATARDVEEADGGGCGETGEDVNENHKQHDQSAKLKQCCELKCALQDSLKQEAVSLSTALTTPTLPSKQQSGDNGHVPHKVKKDDDDLEPLPIRVQPALYTYSNPDKSRGGSESPSGLSDEDSNSCSTSSSMIHAKQSKSLLEQLLIEIPHDHQSIAPSSPSPATRSSMRTRALSKLGSPELASSVSKIVTTARTHSAVATAKRKRNESDSSSQGGGGVDDNKKKRKSEGEGVKTRREENAVNKASTIKKVVKIQQEESSDSDEPLIEKVRKPANACSTQSTVVSSTTTTTAVPAAMTTTTPSSATAKSKMKTSTLLVGNNNKGMVVNTRRSVRSNMPAQNTRSKGDKVVSQAESDALRRKTRSAVSDVENKRKKEVK